MEYKPEDIQPWEIVEPPYWWSKINMYIIADRTLPDGVRQHMVRGYVKVGTVVNNAQILMEKDCQNDLYSSELSPLSDIIGS